MVSRMRGSSLRFLLAPLLILFCSGLTPGFATPTLRLTVRQVIHRARSSDPGLDQLQHKLTRLREKISPRVRARLPRLFCEYEGSESYDWNSPYRRMHRLGAGFEVDLTDSGASWYRSRELQREIERTQLQISQLQQNLTLEMLQLCLQIFYHRRVVGLFRANLRFYRQLHAAAEQRTLSGTISAQAYQRIRLRTQEKALELQAEQLELQHLYSQLKLKLREDRRIELAGALPERRGAWQAILEKIDRKACRSHAQDCSLEPATARIDCRQAADQRALQLRSLCPAVRVYSRIDFSGSAFPPAQPMLSFGLKLSTGAGPLLLSAEDAASRSTYSYGRTPAARAEIDLTREPRSAYRETAEQLEYSRRKLDYTIALAGEQAEQLYSEATHLVNLLQNQTARLTLYERGRELEKQKFNFGSVDFESLVEHRSEYTEQMLELLQLKVRCTLTFCRLMQHCAIPEEITTLINLLSSQVGRLPDDSS